MVSGFAYLLSEFPLRCCSDASSVFEVQIKQTGEDSRVMLPLFKPADAHVKFMLKTPTCIRAAAINFHKFWISDTFLIIMSSKKILH